MADAVNNVNTVVANMVAYGLPTLFVILLGVVAWREYEKWMSK